MPSSGQEILALPHENCGQPGELEWGRDPAVQKRLDAERRRNRIAVSVLLTITIIAVIAAILATRATNQATARRMATDARLAAEEGRLRLATLLAIEAAQRESSAAAQIWSDVPRPR